MQRLGGIHTAVQNPTCPVPWLVLHVWRGDLLRGMHSLARTGRFAMLLFPDSSTTCASVSFMVAGNASCGCVVGEATWLH